MQEQESVTSEAIEVIVTLIEQERHNASQQAERAKRAWSDHPRPRSTEAQDIKTMYFRWSAVEARMTDLRRQVNDVLRALIPPSGQAPPSERIAVTGVDRELLS